MGWKETKYERTRLSVTTTNQLKMKMKMEMEMMIKEKRTNGNPSKSLFVSFLIIRLVGVATPLFTFHF